MKVKSKFGALLACAIVLIMYSTVLFAEEAKSQQKTVTGTITSVNSKLGDIVVKVDGEDKSLKICDVYHYFGKVSKYLEVTVPDADFAARLDNFDKFKKSDRVRIVYREGHSELDVFEKIENVGKQEKVGKKEPPVVTQHLFNDYLIFTINIFNSAGLAPPESRALLQKSAETIAGKYKLPVRPKTKSQYVHFPRDKCPGVFDTGSRLLVPQFEDVWVDLMEIAGIEDRGSFPKVYFKGFRVTLYKKEGKYVILFPEGAQAKTSDKLFEFKAGKWTEVSISAIRFYDGPALPRDKVAIIIATSRDIKSPDHKKPGIAAIIRVDGREVPRTAEEIEVLPGQHEISFLVQFRPDDAPAGTLAISSSSHSKMVEMKEGHAYRIAVSKEDGNPFVEEVQIREGARQEIIGTMKKHVEALKKQSASLPGYDVTWPRWEKLFSEKIQSFSSTAAFEEIDNALRDGKHHVRAQTFDGIYVAVSALPTIDNHKAMSLFPGGYFTVLDGLLKKSGWLQSDRDFAHWIYCYDGKDKHGVHLTFIPSKALSGKDNVWIFAQDLMTDSEKRRAGIK